MPRRDAGRDATRHEAAPHRRARTKAPQVSVTSDCQTLTRPVEDLPDLFVHEVLPRMDAVTRGKFDLSMNALMPGVPLMAQSLGGAFVIDMGIQLVGWAFAATYKTEKFYDLCGSLAFSATAALTFASSAMLPRQVLATSMARGSR